MNIAFPAALIFLLALPGSILSHAYREQSWQFDVYRQPLAAELATSVFGAAVLHSIWCGLAPIFGYHIVFRDVLILLVGGNGMPPDYVQKHLEAVSLHPGAIGAYFGSIYLGAFLIGLCGRFIVLRNHLDWRFKLLRFRNFWHYALSAELPLFWENRHLFARRARVPVKLLKDQIVLVRVSGVVNHGSGSYVYAGTPYDYVFDRTGGLEKIFLREVVYQKLYDFSEFALPRGKATLVPRLLAGRAERVPDQSGDAMPASTTPGPSSSPWLPIETDVFVLNVVDAHNIGIEYIYLAPADA